MKPNARHILFLLVSAFFISCEDQQVALEPIQLNLSQSTNMTNKEVLGKVLFYDKQMSLNNTVSCASCHKQHFAFADNEKLSVGFENKRTLRNTLPIQDIGSSSFISNTSSLNTVDPFFSSQVFFWDGREQSLNSLISQPIVNHIEMGTTNMSELVSKLSKLPYYQTLFEQSYGSNSINEETIANAVTAFLKRIKSNNSKFEKIILGEDNFSALEKEGSELFNNKFNCNTCHQVQQTDGYLFAGVFANIGLDGVYKDTGVMSVTDDNIDNGKFKIPNLRNVAVTAPYMHDGRFQTLDEVLDFYSIGIQNNENLDPRLKNNQGQAKSNNISDHEKLAIIAFLNTLTDYEMLTNPELSNPFN